MIVVSDSSPLIAFSAIDRLELLQHLFGTVLIPDAVHKEVVGTANTRTIHLPDFIRLEPIVSETSVRFLKMNLHPGESEAIALAFEKGVDKILLDDKQARETADRLGLKVLGTLGVLMLAKEKGYLAEVRSAMLQLIDQINFRISPAVLNRALLHINEPPL